MCLDGSYVHLVSIKYLAEDSHLLRQTSHFSTSVWPLFKGTVPFLWDQNTLLLMSILDLLTQRMMQNLNRK